MAVFYGNDEPCHAGNAKVVKQSAKDQALMDGTETILYKVLTTAAELEKKGIAVHVLEPSHLLSCLILLVSRLVNLSVPSIKF